MPVRARSLLLLAGFAGFLMAGAVPAQAAGTAAATRPVGSAPLSDATAAARVRRSSFEPRRRNGAANRRTVSARELASFEARSTMPYRSRVSGAFSGTTDEILQWAAHKHGVEADLLRAVAVKESWWRMSHRGDAGDSFGIMQMRRPFHCCLPFMARSTAFNVDYYAATLRAYYEGRMPWLNDVERGREYRAGDLWGSVGAWFSGRWHTPAAESYIRDVRRIRRARTWRSEAFAREGRRRG